MANKSKFLLMLDKAISSPSTPKNLGRRFCVAERKLVHIRLQIVGWGSSIISIE
ncbi:MAG: hypothetical protein AAB819_01700 [Patescibacteria group bacterium]